MVVIFVLLLSFFGISKGYVELSVRAPYSNESYELVKEPLRIDVHRCNTGDAKITCFCYESTAPETPKHPYCKTKYSGFCTENDAVLHMFTGYGDGNTTAFLINYSTGKKVPVPPMKVQMAVSQDKNFVPSINFYVVSYKFRATSQSDSTPKEYEVEGCGLANVFNVYSEKIDHILNANDPLADTKARCVNECYCKKSI